MRSVHTQVLLNYWRQTRGEQSAPQKADISPRDIKSHLAFTFLLKRDGADRYMFHLAGTGLCDLFGRELKGQSFVHLWAESSRDAASASLNRVTHLSVPTVSVCVAETADQRPLTGELLLLPYAGANGDTSWIMGHFQSLEPLSRLYGRKLVRMRMGTSAILTGDAHGPSAIDLVDAKRSSSHLRVVSAHA
jgi:hypothetical protein